MVRTKKIDTTFIHQEIISGKICDELIDFYESGEGTAGVPKVRGMMSGDKKPILNRAAKDCEESYYRGFPQNYRDALEKVCNNYKKKYEYSTRSSAPWQVGPVIKIQKYYPGTSYSALHYENQGFGISLYRHLVFMTYLNDIKTGGGTFWHYQNLTTKPKKGLTVIWPAIWTHTHKGLPAPKELKYICTGWYEWENNLD